jgi:pimeloyl-ACP methyl ester carboxylesterase
MKYLLLLVSGCVPISSVGQNSISRSERVFLNGIEQYITLKGKDESLPLLLFLHGGPGGSVLGYDEKFTSQLQEHFVVIQWDQRETGKTLELNQSPVPLSLSVFQDDTRELIEILLKRFARDKLYLVGHSWGTFLGFQTARFNASLLYAFVAIGPMINQLESERIALELMKEKARQTVNQEELEELATVKIPFENGEQLFYHRKWLLSFSGSHKKLSRSFVMSWSTTWLKLYNEASKKNFAETLPSIDCPVYFFAGRNDYQTNSHITEAYHKTLTAPKKALFWFESSAHSIPGSEPERMQRIIIEKILPETFTLPGKEVLQLAR